MAVFSNTGGGTAAAKLNRSALSSDSSVDDELSYLNLDSGHVMTKQSDGERISMTSLQYESIMSKFHTLEKGLSKLEKLDKLDQVKVR
ncbi:hypothetical protein DPMN_156955 [Dreissena polymorpha]|uniref:Uncharacterized protein n=1 Tax=Dreissena polymorpha TaxID=45954 RepID=A0A9D4JCA7_DREPO|nr:hypothetical protein DPMN_156955 [Dreissena polymorpha]